MNELLKRAFFGLLYVSIVILALQSYLGVSLLFLFFLIFGLYEFSKLSNMNFKTGLLPALFIFIYFFLANFSPKISKDTLQISRAFLVLSLFIPLVFFIFDKISKENISDTYLALVYLALPFSLALGIDTRLLLAVFVIIWASDTFAYLTGKYFGKHKLAEKISPKKTIEGFIGGLLGSLFIAFIFYKYIGIHTSINLKFFMLLAVVVVVFGTLGDLLESRFKRLANVKDSGNLIPGHGGILDRLDSFILSVPFVYVFLVLLI